MSEFDTKFCKFCGKEIAFEAVVCVHCGRQVEELKKTNDSPNIVINNSSSSTNTNTNTNVNANINTSENILHPCGKRKNKWVAFFLCLCFGLFGIHKFYEGKVGMGILYMFTGGIFGLGWFIDSIVLLFKPRYYYVR